MKTISEQYQELNKQHHQDCQEKGIPWGKSVVTSHLFDPIVRFARIENIKTILDYGSGHGVMASWLRGVGFEVTEYDPGIVGKDQKPNGMFDMTISLDVLEHVESEYIENALDEISGYTRQAGFFTISLIPAQHQLPGGVNAHQTVRNSDWWMCRLKNMFAHIDSVLSKRNQLVVRAIR